jgi:uncharacterized protein (TIGR03435 family)
MTNQVRKWPRRAGILSLAGVAVLAGSIVISLIFGIDETTAIHAQSRVATPQSAQVPNDRITPNQSNVPHQSAPIRPVASPLSFDAVSVRPVLWTADRDCSAGIAGSKDPGRFRCPTITLKELLQKGYSVYSFQLEGPSWLDAKPPAFFYVEATMPTDTTKAQLGEMLQTMLSERFKLAAHTETRELPIYSLVVGKGGPHMKESLEMETTADDSSPPQPGPKDSYGMPTFQLDHPAIFMIQGPATRLIVKQQTIGQFVNWLTAPLGRKVIDATGLTAKYDFTLTFANEGSVPQADVGGPPDVRVALQEQLGLRLESGKGPVDVIVVDHIEKAPTEN